MDDFKTMFPDMEVDVIEAVLRSNNGWYSLLTTQFLIKTLSTTAGAVDETIDQLLTMTADCSQSVPEPPQYSSNSLPTYKEALRLDSVSEMLGASSLQDQPDLLSGLDMMGASGGEETFRQHQHWEAGESGPLRHVRNWRPPLLGKLPSDFLRLKPRHGHSYSHPHRPSSSSSFPGRADIPPVSERRNRTEETERNHQLIEDEKFAMMLQNEEFMKELRGNKEFMSALEEEDHYQPVYNTVPAPDKPKDLARRPHLGMDDALFREKLKNMGKTSKQKFSKLATMFSRQRGASRVLGQAPAPSKDNLLLNADPVSNNREDTDSEEDSHCTTKGRKYQLM